MTVVWWGFSVFMQQSPMGALWLSAAMLILMLRTARIPHLQWTMERGCVAAVANTAHGLIVVTRVLVTRAPQLLVSCLSRIIIRGSLHSIPKISHLLLYPGYYIVPELSSQYAIVFHAIIGFWGQHQLVTPLGNSYIQDFVKLQKPL